MLDAINIKDIIANTKKPITTQRFSNDCEKFPGTTALSEKLSKILDDLSISDVEFPIWTGID